MQDFILILIAENNSPTNLYIDTNEKIYGLDKHSLLNIETLIFCPSKEPILPGQLCRHYISPGKEMKITLDLMYRRENLKNWKQIQIASLNLVSEFIQK